MIFSNPIRITTLSKRFKNSHCEAIDIKIKGVIQSNIDYIQKVSKHVDKKSCQVEGTWEEVGIRPVIREKKQKEKLADIILKYLEKGMSTADMIKADSRLLNKIRDIELARQTLISQEYMIKERNINVIYIYGKPRNRKNNLCL